MANASLFSRTRTHFFQPLLPGFQTHLKIPVKFFSEHIEGKHEGKTVKLRSDASERTWEVKMEDCRLTIGWKEFVEAHDLRIGDFVVFRHKGDMLFHVTALGTSCCEIQYTLSRSHEEDEESDENETEISSRSENEFEENVKIASDQSSTDLNCFSQSVTASNLSRDRVAVPLDFADRNGLNKGRLEIVLMNEEGGLWASELASWASCRVNIVRGWTSFCTANNLKVGDFCTFRLLLNSETPAFRLCSRTKAERKRKVRSEEDYIDYKTEESRFVKLTLTASSLDLGKQHLPVSFTRVNMLNKPGKIILVDKEKIEWPMKLSYQRNGLMYIFSGKGWKGFCAANEVGAGESLTLELIRGGTSPVLKFCSKMEEPPLEAYDGTHKRARVQNWTQETKQKIEIREKTDAEGEPSRASNKSSGNQSLQHTRPCSVSDQVSKVKQCVVDTLTCIRRFLTEFETMEQKLEDSLKEINNLERREDNGNKTTSSGNNQEV